MRFTFQIFRYWRVWRKMIDVWEAECSRKGAVTLQPGESVTFSVPLDGQSASYRARDVLANEGPETRPDTTQGETYIPVTKCPACGHEGSDTTGTRGNARVFHCNNGGCLVREFLVFPYATGCENRS